MRWTEYDERLRQLWNLIITAYSDTVSFNTSQRAEEDAFNLMQELTELLKDKSI